MGLAVLDLLVLEFQLGCYPQSQSLPPHRFDWVAFPPGTVVLAELTFVSVS